MEYILGVLWILVGLFLIIYSVLLISNTIKTKLKKRREKDDKKDKS